MVGVCVCVCGGGGGCWKGIVVTRKNDENNKNVVSLFRDPTVIATSSSVGVQKGIESQRTVTIRWLLEQSELNLFTATACKMFWLKSAHIRA